MFPGRCFVPRAGALLWITLPAGLRSFSPADTMNTIRPEHNTAPGSPAPEPHYGWDWRAISGTDIACLLSVSTALVFAYWANFVDLCATWSREPDYTHGYLVLPISLFILWRLWPQSEDIGPRVWLPGLLLVLGALGLRAWFQERGQNWSETATVLLAIVGLSFSRLGWRTMRVVWPAFAFLIFWLPLPPSVNSSLSQPLQSIATRAATGVLRMSGLWVMPEGNVIMVGSTPLEVAQACNGLSMLMSLAASVAATASVLPMPLYKRLILMLSIVPIALASNILRIAATAWCYYYFGADVGSKYAHDAAGWLMMPMAMGFVGLELLGMSWLIVERRRVVDPFAAGFNPTQGEIRQ